MNTRDLIGQSPLIAAMERILASGRVVHAYLFTGPAGAGKKTMSSLLAQALLCTSQGSRPCSLCSTCRQFEGGSHPDVFWIRRPEGKTGISVGQIRDLQAAIKVKPYQAGKRVCFIDNAHLMTQQAQNALLKTLEEPPSHTLFFLLAESTSALLPTILSRCQTFRIGALPQQMIIEILHRRLSISQEDAGMIAALSQGNPGKALALAEDEAFRSSREILLRSMSQAGSVRILDAYEVFADNRHRVEDLFHILQLWIRDLLVLKETGEWGLVINLDQAALLKKQVSYFTSEALKDMIEKIEDSRKMLKSNSNYQPTIENMLLSFQGGTMNAACSRSPV
ncbi:MAG: DNA polymerase III subunit delta' [Caldicoprobacterales bacterium]|jgi:DNA polymerase-3 subunit delta'|nr:DNA polymerase III subunit delta' [Clostridiales bacterium]